MLKRRHSKRFLVSLAVFAVFFLVPSLRAEAATLTISPAGGNYNAATTWVEGVVPTSADDVVAMSLSGPLTVNAASAAKTVNFTNYTNTLTMNASLSVSGSVTLVPAMTISGSSALAVNATATLTANGKTWPAALQFSGAAATYTLADNWTVSGAVSVTAASTFNGNTLSCGGNLTYNSTTAGTTTFVMNGTGAWSGSGTFRNNLTFNTSGTITASGTETFNSATIRYIAGTMITTGSTLNMASTSTINTAGMTWNNVQFGGTAITYTLASDLNLSGTLTFNGTTTTAINGAFNINVGGGIATTTAVAVSGTSSIVMNGTGAWSDSGNGTLGNKLTFNTAGTITISGTVSYRTGPLTYAAGTMVTTGSTLAVNSATTLNTSGMTWNNITFSNNPVTYTLSSDLNLSGNLVFTLVGSNVINGAFNINVGGSLTLSGTGTNLSGTASIVMNGTGTWSGGAALKNNLTFNTAGTITVSGSVLYDTGTLRYMAGTVTTTGSTLFVAATAALNTSGMSWNNATLSGASAITLGSNMAVGGNLSVGGSTLTTAINGAYSIIVTGNVTQPGTTSIVSGTATIVMNGTGAWSTTSTGGIRTNLTLSGTITLSGTVVYSTNTLTISGTLVTAGSTLSIGSGTLAVNATGVAFNAISSIGAAALAINGTNGFSAASFSNTVAGSTVTWKSGNTYAITSALTLAGTSGSHVAFQASLSGIQANISLQNDATHTVSYVNATDLNSSGGQTIYDYQGTLSNTANWIAAVGAVTGVSASLANGSYGVGQAVPVQVTFDEPMTVTGVPQLTLSTGTPATTAVNYSSGSGTTTLVFNYTVSAGNSSADLAYASTAALALNGGTIADASGHAAVLTLATPGASGSLSFNKNIAIDTAAPALAEVTPVSTPTNDSTPDYSFSTTEAGTIAYGGDCSSATTAATAGTNTVTLNSLADGTHSNCTVAVADAAGNASPALAVTSFAIDTSVPTVTNVAASSANGSYTTGAVIPIQVTLSAAVTVTGTPTLTLATGTPATTAVNYASGSGTATLVFNYTVASGNTSSDLDYSSTSALSVSGGTIKNQAGTAATLALPPPATTGSLGANKNIRIDTAPPVLAQITPVATPTNDTTPDYAFNTTEQGFVTYGGSCASSTMLVLAGNNNVTFNALAPGTYANCTIRIADSAGNLSNTLAVPSFTVDTAPPVLTQVTPVPSPTNDTTPDYVFSSTEAGTISYGGDCASTTATAIAGSNTISFNTLSSGTHSNCTIRVTDAAGNQSSPLAVASFSIDTSAPTLTTRSITSNNAHGHLAKAGDAVTLSFTASEPIATPAVSFESGGVAVAGTVTISNPSGNNWTAAYVAASGDSEGAVTFTIAFSDLAGNAGTTVTTATDSSSVTFDRSIPMLSEVTPIATPTGDSTPFYVFSTTEAGTIGYGGDCSSSATSAAIGDNGITFNTLSDGTHANCAIRVTDTAGNQSSALLVSSFTVDTSEPVLAETEPVPTPTSTATSEYGFSASEAGTVAYGGSCGGSLASAITGGNTTRLTVAPLGPSATEETHADCTLILTDAAGNSSNVLAVSPFVYDPTSSRIVSVDAATPDGAYGEGEAIILDVAFDEAVTVSGVPELLLETGAVDHAALYAGGSGTSTLVFRYEVAVGDNAAHLDYVDADALVVGGGTIRDAAGNDAGPGLPDPGAPGSLGANASITLDTVQPVLAETAAAASPANDSTPEYSFSTSEAGTISYGGDCSSATTSAVLGDNTVIFDALSDGIHSDCTITVTDGIGNVSAPLVVSSFTIDTAAPALVEVTPVPSLTSDATPEYVFSSTKAGAIAYGGDCSASSSTAVSGNNTVAFDALSDGPHTNCTIQVTDALDNASVILSVSDFTVDATAPVLSEVTPVAASTNDPTPDYTFSSTEAGTIGYGGDCSSTTTDATAGSNTVPFETLADGTHANCRITVIDAIGNHSQPLTVTPFAVITILPPTKFVILDPADTTVGVSTAVTVQARKADDSLDTTYQDDVTLVASGSATGAGLVDIVNGVGTLTINDTVAETVALSLSDTQFSGLDVASVQDLAFSYATSTISPSVPTMTATKFVILDPTDAPAGSMIAITMQAQASDDSIDTNYQSDVTLIASGSATGAGLVDIVNGVGTITLTDAVPETVNLSLLDSEATGLAVASAEDVAFQSISTGPAIKFAIDDPLDAYIRTPVSVTVKALRADNSIDTSYNGSVMLASSGAATGAGVVTLTNGIGAILISDATAETITLSLFDSASTGLDVGSTQDAAFRIRPGGIAPLPPTEVRFFIRAYLDASVSIFRRTKDTLQDVPIKKDQIKLQNGSITETFEEPPIATTTTYGIAVTDRDGRNTQTKFFSIDTKPNKTVEKDVFAVPTVGIAQARLASDDTLEVTGYATPGSTVQLSVDDTIRLSSIQTQTGGVYYGAIPVAGLAAGPHTVRAKQTDAKGASSDFSLTAMFSVGTIPKLDLNGDGIINISDWSKFLSLWLSGTAKEKKAIDFNGDGTIDASDFSIFSQAYKKSIQ